MGITYTMNITQANVPYPFAISPVRPKEEIAVVPTSKITATTGVDLRHLCPLF